MVQEFVHENLIKSVVSFTFCFNPPNSRNQHSQIDIPKDLGVLIWRFQVPYVRLVLGAGGSVT